MNLDLETWIKDVATYTTIKNIALICHYTWNLNRLHLFTTQFFFQQGNYWNNFSASSETICHDFLKILFIGTNQFDFALIYNAHFIMCYFSDAVLKKLFPFTGTLQRTKNLHIKSNVPPQFENIHLIHCLH